MPAPSTPAKSVSGRACVAPDQIQDDPVGTREPEVVEPLESGRLDRELRSCLEPFDAERLYFAGEALGPQRMRQGGDESQPQKSPASPQASRVW